MAFDYYMKAIEKGNIKALGRIGDMYYYGRYVEKDFNKAFKYLKEAAEAKSYPSAHAMRLLSACYRYGLGTKIDVEKEKYWLEEAAKHKDDKAMVIMGME